MVSRLFGDGDERATKHNLVDGRFENVVGFLFNLEGVDTVISGARLRVVPPLVQKRKETGEIIQMVWKVGIQIGFALVRDGILDDVHAAVAQKWKKRLEGEYDVAIGV